MAKHLDWRIRVGPEPVVPIGRGDAVSAVLIAAVFALALAVSWQRWGDLVIDRGREMNVPLRLLHGQLLYGDVHWFYGPLSPYWNAMLYKLFGVSLDVLYANGIITTGIILALVFWLARRLMRPAGAAWATLGVLWLCALKISGNFIFPYAYAALHGLALGLLALVLVARFVETGRTGWLLGASLVAGLALLTKTECGLPALAAGAVAVSLTREWPLRARWRALAIFVAPAAGLAMVTYACFAARVGWPTLWDDSFLFFANVPPELLHFNAWKSGLDRPWYSLWRMFAALLQLGSLGGMMAIACMAFGGRASLRPGRLLGPVGIFIVALLIFVGTTALRPDRGPFLAVPLILAALIAAGIAQRLRAPAGHPDAERRALVLVTMAVYALASLARVILRVPSGGAYGSYVLPVSLVLFVYAWVELFPRIFTDARVRNRARTCSLALVVLGVIGTAIGVTYQYRRKDMRVLRTERGTIVALGDQVEAFEEAMALIERQAGAGDFLAVLPEATSLNFFTGRRNPLWAEIHTPGMLDARGEERAIARLQETRTPLVLVANRPTAEFGPAVFGRDYYPHLMRFIEEHYRVCAVLGPDERPEIAIGDRTFFFRAYCAKNREGKP